MNRRLFLKGLAATAGLVLPTGLTTDAEEVRRFWALNGSMLRQGGYLETGWFDAAMPSFEKVFVGPQQGDLYFDSVKLIPMVWIREGRWVPLDHA